MASSAFLGVAVGWDDMTVGLHGRSSSHRLAQACSCDIWAGKCGRPLEGPLKLAQHSGAQSKSSDQFRFKKWGNRNFRGSPVVKTSPSNAGDVGSTPGREAAIPHAWRPQNQNINGRSNIVTNSI